MVIASGPLIIGLGFKARNGKDTLASMTADALRDLGVSSERLSFADDLKALARCLGMQAKNAPALQKLGEACRELDPDFWVKRLMLRVASSSALVVFVPDMRFPNELRRLWQQGAITIRVDRVLPNGETYTAADRDPTHVSETALANAQFDYRLVAPDGDLAALREHARWLSRLAYRRLAQERKVRP